MSGRSLRNHRPHAITTFEAQYGRDRLSNIVLEPERPELMPNVLARDARGDRPRPGHTGILLADEPTRNLDTASGGDVMSLFEEPWRQGRTMLIIAHDPALARRAPRRIEIKDGRIEADTR